MKPPSLTPNLAEAVFSVKSFAASMAALYIAFGMGLPRPFWAMMTAYVVSSPLSGAVRSKAVFRVAGTVLGSAASVVMVVELVNAPELLVAAIGLWVAGCLYLSLLDRTPRSYVFMLAGYTAGLVAFPGVADPGAIFDTGLARVEEIVLGIVCATIVHSVVLPRGVGPVLLGRLDATLDDAERWTLDALSGGGNEKTAVDRQKLARDLTELRVMATHLPYDTSEVRWMTRPVRALQDRMTYLLPVLAAVDDWMTSVRGPDGALPPDLVPVVEDLKRWIADDESVGGAEAQRAALDALAPAVNADSTWRDATRLGLLARLRTLVDIHQDCRELRAHIRSGDQRLPERLDPLTRSRSRGVFHLDHGMALWSGASAILGLAIVCAFWIATGWSSGAAAAMMVAVFSCFFAAFDDPAPGIRMFLVFTLLSLPVAAFYLLVVLPSFDSFTMLAASLAPTFLLLGAYVARPATFGQAMALLFGVAGALSLLDTSTADFASFLNSSIGQIIGIVTALLVTRLCRSVGAAWSARRLLRAGWREVAALADARSAPPFGSFENRMLDRVGLLSTRLAQAGPQDDVAVADAVNDLRVGLNVADLQRVRPMLGGTAESLLGTLLAEVGRHYRGLSTRRLEPPRPGVRRAMDTALAGIAAAPPAPERDRAVVALVSLRRSLFREDAPQVTTPALPELVTT
ncbi:FUSC family protein [Azospirillum doebereinerae]